MAASMTVIDYTALKVGYIVRRQGGQVVERIERCPECGRSGLRSAFGDRRELCHVSAGGDVP